MHLTDPILVNAIDLHAHYGPDVYTRYADAFEIAQLAADRGIEHIIVTHPMLGGQYTDINPDQLQEAVALGSYVEFVATEFENQDHASLVIDSIRRLGPGYSFISSDSGLINHRNHTDALVNAIQSLRAAGFSEAELTLMFRDNPARLLGLD